MSNGHSRKSGSVVVVDQSTARTAAPEIWKSRRRNSSHLIEPGRVHTINRSRNAFNQPEEKHPTSLVLEQVDTCKVSGTTSGAPAHQIHLRFPAVTFTGFIDSLVSDSTASFQFPVSGSTLDMPLPFPRQTTTSYQVGSGRFYSALQNTHEF